MIVSLSTKKNSIICRDVFIDMYTDVANIWYIVRQSAVESWTQVSRTIGEHSTQ